MRKLTAFTISCLALTITLNTNAGDTDAGVVEARPIGADAVRVKRVDGEVRAARAEKRGNRTLRGDANGNGVVDRDEFRGKDERFDKMDADGNGELTHEEIKAAHKARRAQRAQRGERGKRGEGGEGSKRRDRRGGDKDDGGDI